MRLILNTHSHIFVPHPPHIVHYFAPLERSYGDLAKDGNMHRLIADVLRLVRIHIYPWDIPLDPEAVLRDALSRSVFGIFAALYDHALAASGKQRWGCKSLYMLHYTQPIFEHFPRAKLIWLFRDPRDVAVSARQSVFNHYHPYRTARRWTQEQQTGLALMAQLSPESFFPVQYEKLIAEPVDTMLQLCHFLDEPFETKMLDFFTTLEAHKSGSLSESWHNTTRPIMTDNAGKYRHQLSAAELRAVETVAGEVMQCLDYALEEPSSPTDILSLAQKMSYWCLDHYWLLCAEWRSLQRDRNHWRRWARVVLMTYLRASRRTHPTFRNPISDLDVHQTPVET